MNEFKAANRRNPCPICDGIKPKCRVKLTEFTLPDGSYLKENQYFCMNWRGDRWGYKYTGETKNLLWGKYIIEELSQELSQIWQKYSKSRNQKRKSKIPLVNKNQVKSQPKSYEHLLTTKTKHQQMTILLDQLALNDNHYCLLCKRGFSNLEISHYRFKSIAYQQPLKIKLNNRLAGIDLDGKRLNNKYSGLLIPITDCRGNYQGWQCRLDDYYESLCKTRYLWPRTGESTAHVKEYAEIPISFTIPLGSISSKYIGLVEGLGFKNILCANRLNQVIIGASGAMFASSPQQFKIYLTEATNLTKEKQVLLYPDAGAIRNHLILIQYKKAAQLAIDAGFDPTSMSIKEYLKLSVFQTFCF